jgi:alpha-tubulin suppressor-like RCC1 family protein
LVGGVAAIAVGDSHSCALARDGRIFCWGANDMGQLGDGTTQDRDTADIPVTGVDDAVAISAGIRFSCAVRADGSVWCWGEDPGSDGSSAVPFEVPGISDAKTVTAGGAFACALREGGQVACWGNNSLGQLGGGTFGGPDQSVPQDVSDISDAIRISSGWNHTCAIRTGGHVWCWGGNGDGATGYGQLGDGTFDNSAVPVQVSGLTNIVEVAAGGWTTCARAADGETSCWGYGEEGTLGDGNQANSSVPVQPGITDARLIAVGRFIACVSRADQSVWCWGDTTWSPVSRPATTPVEGTRTRPNAISALAVDRYVVLLDNGGRVWTWGSPTPHQLPVGP